MKKLLLFIAYLLFIFSTNAQGDIKKQTQLSDKVFFGAGLGLQFGTVTSIEVTPMVGYIPIENLYTGIKGKYEYFDNTYMPSGTHVYGGSLFASYAFLGKAMVYGEYEMLSMETQYFDPYYQYGSGDRFLLKTPLLGVGYLQSLGGRSKVMLLVLWNLSETNISYYSNPIIKVSFMF